MGHPYEVIRRVGGRKVSRVFSGLSALGLLLSSGSLYAQGTPSEFAELSLQELLNIPIYSAAEEDAGKRWLFSYHYSQMNIQGYQDGSRKLSRVYGLQPRESWQLRLNYDLSL